MTSAFKVWDEAWANPEPTPEEIVEMKKRREYTMSLNAMERQKKMREVLKTVSLLIIGILALGIMLIYLSFVLVPLVFSRFLVYIFQPLIDMFTGKSRFPFLKFR